MSKKEEEITVEVDGVRVKISKKKYIKAKTKDLKEFGYPDLTQKHVAEQLEKVLKGQKLTVIGKFIEGDIIMD